MIPPSFEYYRAVSVEDAVRALAEDPGAKALAGGQSLIPLLKLRALAPTRLVDIGRIKELKYIAAEGEALRIGALTTHRELEQGPCRILREAASQIGDPQIRSMGTIGGSLAHADPAGDWPAVALALRASIKVRGPNGLREVRADDFFLGPYTTALGQGELVAEVYVPSCPSTSSYVKLSRRHNDFAIAAVAAVLWIKGGVVESAGLAATGVGVKPVRLAKAESALVGKRLDERAIEEAAAAAAEEVQPISDVRASAEYRRAVLPVVVKRAIKRAAGL
nr:MAG: carbon monoxide dehydrogenase [Thermoproteus sp. AZ2]